MMVLISPTHSQSLEDYTNLAVECVPIMDLSKVGHISPLNKDQFQFIRGMFVIIPPVSHTLPIGEFAVKITGGDKQVMVGLVNHNQIKNRDEMCARFMVPDFIEKMIDQAGNGKPVLRGDPT